MNTETWMDMRDDLAMRICAARVGNMTETQRMNNSYEFVAVESRKQADAMIKELKNHRFDIGFDRDAA